MDGLIRSRAQYAAGALFLSVLYAIFLWHSPSTSHTLARRDGAIGSLTEILPGPESNLTLHRRDDYTCSKDEPCENGACCGKSGNCGYGPKFCDDDVCLSNCDAHAECGQYALEEGKECPLNVCCSQHGFCGTTELYCDDKCQSNCGQPSVPDGKSSRPVRDKVIAYYESWASNRKCSKFQPWNIPTKGVTHVNFAFAYIDPDSFEITTMDSETPETLFQQTAGLKSMKSGITGSALEVWISVGGWTFSDNGTDTQAVFGEISKSEENRQTFADNLVSFMTRYGFDGVDLDWEYPGAPDRGGKKDDPKNFVKLMQTLRTTFDNSPKGSYGLTFTIPSSYWYLRWFDVPAMLEQGADWVNLMSYDLHGVWDKNNPIGSYVHGHTNLTEIKASLDLLWRNNVPPGKVILGTGFYGRSFQLKDGDCNKPGCGFKGAAKKGECTGEGGILGYFEIMEILKDNKDIEVIHDKEAAVNYFSWDDDQWVSYDDKKTFEQKVKFADDVGLGGLMTWAIDLDDEKFTALEGLIGRDPGKGTVPGPDEINDQTDSWSSDNGQSCYTTDCNVQCPSSVVILERYKSNCDSGYKSICCPRDRVPRDCQWRGGESGSACHGQCHNGELTLFYDSHGDEYCSSGDQAYCCTADRYKDLLDRCELSGCGGECDDGRYPVARQWDFNKCGGGFRTWCCKDKIHNCHWVGQGSCDDNNCDEDDLQLALSSYGEGPYLCGVAGRKKSLCCDPPDSVDVFTPVPLDRLFPDPPPSNTPVKWDLQILGGYDAVDGVMKSKNPTADPDFGAFGFVLIAGPKYAVSSFSKRDESHIEILDCDSITPSASEKQVTRLICTDDGEDSNCDDVLEGGLDGTVVRMPDNCGHGAYIVAHSLQESADQTLPKHLEKRATASRRVMDLEFSYNFGLIKKRADGDQLQMRVDYSNMPNYWSTIVEEEGEESSDKRKRSVHPELSHENVHKRFFSDETYSWAKKFDNLVGTSYRTDFSNSFNTVLFEDRVKGCEGDHDDENYLRISSSGECEVEAKFGFTFIASLGPFEMQQAYGFLDLKYDLEAVVKVAGRIAMDTKYVSQGAHAKPKSELGFTHLGLFEFSPKFDVDMGVEADEASFTANFMTALRTSTDPEENDGWIRLRYPESAGGNKGGVRSYPLKEINGTQFDGEMDADRGSVDITLQPDFTIDLDFSQAASWSQDDSITKRDSYGDLQKRQSGKQEWWGISIFNRNGIHWDRGGVELQVDSAKYLSDHLGGDSFGWGSNNGENVGVQPGAIKLHTSIKGEDPDVPTVDWDDVDSDPLFSPMILECPAKDIDDRPCNADLCGTIIDCPEPATSKPGSDETGSDDDDDNMPGTPVDERKARRELLAFLHEEEETLEEYVDELSLEPRGEFSLDRRDPKKYSGSPRKFNSGLCRVRRNRWRPIIYKSLSYPTSGNWESNDIRYSNVYDAGDPSDYADGSIGKHKLIPGGRQAVTEHIIELQTMSIFLKDVSNNKLPGGKDPGIKQIFCNFVERLEEDFLSNPSATPGSTTNSKVPLTRIMQITGWKENWKGFVLLEKTINRYKENLWSGKQPVQPSARKKLNGDPKKWCAGLINIRTVINVFSYMNDAQVHDHWVLTSNRIRNELQQADDTWKKKKNPSTKIPDYWDKWIRAHMKRMSTDGEAFARLCINEMRATWRPLTNDKDQAQVLRALDKLERQLNLVTIDISGLT